MARIIPAILADNREDFIARVELISPHVDLVHIDVMDGTFVPEISFGEPDEVQEICSSLGFEAHLMITNPLEEINNWFNTGAERIVFHAEACDNFDLILKKAKENHKKLGVAFNPETKIEDFKHFLEQVDFVQFMGVNPGAMGREFHPTIFEKIPNFKTQHPNLKISVDGGVSEKNIKQLVIFGVEDLVIGSAIFKTKNPLEALKNLQKLI